MRDTVHPVSVGFWENPNPGSDGTTTSNESAASPPNETGSVSGPISFRNSTIEPGHPRVSISGIALGLEDMTWMKWLSRLLNPFRTGGTSSRSPPRGLRRRSCTPHGTETDRDRLTGRTMLGGSGVPSPVYKGG